MPSRGPRSNPLGMTDQPQRKAIRLPPAAYRDPASTWLVTIATQGRRPAFHDITFADAFITLLRERITAANADLLLACLMPDHVHLIVQIGDVSLVDIVRDLKSRSTRLWWTHGENGTVWQRAFRDRGLHTARDMQATAAYVLDNPVRAGLVESWEAYPHLFGSLIATKSHPSRNRCSVGDKPSAPDLASRSSCVYPRTARWLS